MRRIKAYFFISLDGVVESPDKWHFRYFDDEMGGAVGAGFATADALLMGRVCYDEWAAYWPEHADQPFGLARLFSPDEPGIPLELVSAQTFNSGVLNLTYAPAGD